MGILRTAVHPAAFELDAEPIAFAGAPLALELAARRPPVHAARLEPALPQARKLALPARARAHPEPVRLPLRPPAHVAPAVVEVEPPARPAACERRRRRRGLARGAQRRAGLPGGRRRRGTLAGLLVGRAEVDGVWGAREAPARAKNAELAEVRVAPRACWRGGLADG